MCGSFGSKHGFGGSDGMFAPGPPRPPLLRALLLLAGNLVVLLGVALLVCDWLEWGGEGSRGVSFGLRGGGRAAEAEDTGRPSLRRCVGGGRAGGAVGSFSLCLTWLRRNLGSICVVDRGLSVGSVAGRTAVRSRTRADTSERRRPHRLQPPTISKPDLRPCAKRTCASAAA